MPIRYYTEFVTVPLAVLFFFIWQHPFANATLTAAICGYLLWVFIEYWMHRGLFHHSKSPFLAAHMIHHRDVFSHDGSPGLVNSSAGLVAVIFLLLALLGEYLGPPTCGGLLIGYWSYLITHHLIHLEWFDEGNYVRMRHELHHKGWAYNYNVLCPLGDLVFGTYKEPKRPPIKDQL